MRLPYFNFKLFYLFFLISQSGFSQTKKLQANRITYPPKIDGILKDDIWGLHENVSRSYFFQSVPENGETSELVTEVQVLYTDFSIYISARMYDPDPASIPAELGIRDDLGRNADYFGVYFDPWNNDQNAFNFIVSAAGVQIDQYITPEGRDRNWDAVWVSDFSIDEMGWVIEMEIPFSALRFPKSEVQTWGINFYSQERQVW